MNDTTPFDCPDCTLTVKHDHPKLMLLVAREQLHGRPEVADNSHELVVELYDGIALSMKCVPCRVRIPIRPERAAAQLTELNYLAREHTEAIGRLDHGITS